MTELERAILHIKTRADAWAVKEIEKALSQEPCDDAISREAVMRLIENKPYDWSNLTERHNMLMEIRKLPPVTQKSGKWISVSERLPEDRDWYLGIFKEMDTGWINPLPFICDYVGTKTKFTTEDFWIIRCGSDREDDSGDYYSSLRCVAWMPLPKPYEPQESEDKE